jgi:hypothetical protein
MSKKTARLVKKMDGWRGDAALYELSEPYDGHDKVVVSAVNVEFSGPETLIFPWDEEANRVTNFLDLQGSYRGDMNHETALANAGYSLEDA